MSRWKKELDQIEGGNTLEMREWVKTEKGIAYKKRHNEYVKEWRKKNKEKFHATQKKCYDTARIDALTQYSGGTPKCACCGEEGLVFLTIDHIHGNGSEERRARTKELGYAPSGNSLVYWLKKNDYPEGYQILCYNCNMAKRNNKQCPHQTGLTHKIYKEENGNQTLSNN